MTDELRQDDEFFDSTFRSLDEDTAQLSSDVVNNVINTAGDVFSSEATSLALSPTAPNSPSTAPSDRVTPPNGQRTMFAFAKPLAVLAASAAVLVVAWFSAPGTVTADVTLGDVLDELRNARSLKLQITQGDKEAEVLVAGNSVRWQDSQQQYRIASGSRLWKIDETANTVSDEANPWVNREGTQVDLVALIGGMNSQSLRSVKASKQVEHAGVLCNVFVFRAGRDSGGPKVRAFADAQTNQLYSLACWTRGDPTTTPPTSELRLVKRNVEFDESLFVVGKSLSEDGRIGKITETQGMVLLRPKTNRRWTPVYGPMIIKPGDWVRTDVRGANAVSIVLSSGYRLILGPGTLVEVAKPGDVILHRGEVNVTGSKSATAALTLNAANTQTASIIAGERFHFQLDREQQLQKQKVKPLWLAGFEGSTTNESIGSLITKIDGRDVPLTVGFHKVNVEIRDQIARTTIEESFINHTRSRLEGVFHFPLPQDASISGFGMWINGELIEADVVEKQRAREIYEEILRQKKDPGLLEWTGGNIFKARVFPIEARSEKRIKIVYTQVLPMRANRYRYSYGLRSEMLQKTPLRELSLNVTVSSALPLKSVNCGTHSVRSDIAKNSATLEFSAQEYTPTRDFEVVCEVDSQESDVVVVPHQRGDDGYFLAQVTPPSPTGNWHREVLPDGNPLKLLLVCDTSGSMDSQKREQQQQFVSAVLASLGDKDSFKIAYCDVDTNWQKPFAVVPNDETTEAAVKWLEERQSLGWTDLDRMTKSVVDRISQEPEPEAEAAADGHTHVIYIGDGIATARDADAQEFANRIRRMTKNLQGGTFHAVSVGSSFESGVLKAIASVGGGSVRKIEGEITPQRTAHELLNEIAQPGLTDVEVEFKGIKVAAVYPGELPNLSAGMQQIIVGRYVPTGGDDQRGEIIITGKRGDETVRYASRITLQEAEKGNSFIPRLWARAHLDQLMEQGSSQFIKDEIIALSEEFHIMTPYTSLLVLESDEQREEFGVKRRFLMRDGEKFFADGRSNANFELLQQQMKAAGNWRLGLRQDILRSLVGMGRDPELFQQSQQHHSLEVSSFITATGAITAADGSGFVSGGSAGGYGGFGRRMSGSRGKKVRRVSRELTLAGDISGSFEDSETDQEYLDDDLQFMDELDEESEQASERVAAKKESRLQQSMSSLKSDLNFRAKRLGESQQLSKLMTPHQARTRSLFSKDRRQNSPMAASAPVSGRYGGGAYAGYYAPGYHNPQQYIGWVNELFPGLAAPPTERRDIISNWPEDAQAVADSLVTSIQLADDAGLEIRSKTEGFNARWNFQSSESSSMVLYSRRRWVSVPQSVNGHDYINWCNDKLRGINSQAFQLGRTRQSTPRDLSTFDPGTRPHAKTSLAKTYTNWTPEIGRDDDGNTLLTLRSPAGQSPRVMKLTIDTARNVVLRVESFTNDKLMSTNTYSDFVQAAGCWWPGKGENHDDKGRLTNRWTQQVQTLAAKEFAVRYTATLPDQETHQLLSFPTPTIREARVADQAASADFDDCLILLLDACQIQDWDAALKFLAKLEATAEGKTGLPWIRQRVLTAARRNEESRQQLLSLATELTDELHRCELFLANQVVNQAGNIADNNELLQLLDGVRSVFDRQPPVAGAKRQWKQHRVNALVSLQRVAEWMPLYREIAAEAPWNCNLQASYARQLAGIGELETAFAWLKQEIGRDAERLPYELQMLRTTYADLLLQHYFLDQLIPLLAEWVAEEPTERSTYDRYLAALVMDNRMEESDAVAAKWMKDAQKPGKLEVHELSRLHAAIQYALGNRYRLYSNWMDPKWRVPLKEVGVYFLNHEHHVNVVAQFLGHHLFHGSKETVESRSEAARLLKANASEYSAERISSLLNWTLNSPDLQTPDWKAIATTLRVRWDKIEKLEDRTNLAAALLRIYEKISPDDQHLQFMRDRIVRAEKLDDAQPAAQFRKVLFDTLLTRTWTAERESEVFRLLPETHAVKQDGSHFMQLVSSLHQAVDAMLEQRINADNQKLQNDGHPEELTRRELAARRIEFRDAARKGLIERLTDERKRLTQNVPAESMGAVDNLLRRWMRIEIMHFEVLTADNSNGKPFDENSTFDRVVKQCQSIIGDAPTVLPEPPNEDADKLAYFRLELLEAMRQERAFTMLSNLALRTSAPEELPNSVMAYIDKGIALGGEDALAWKEQRLSMLIALDQPEALEKDLRQWIREEDYVADKQLMLARILAEQGKVADAITLFETVERKVPLSSDDYEALAKWYMVVDRKDDYRRARVQVFKQIEEWQINQWINQQRQQWINNGGVQHPTELDEDVLFAFQALFEKSNSPGNYIYTLRNFYTACRDFRLLKMVPDSVVGRTSQQAYSFLNQLRSNLLQELRNEATADEIMNRLNEVRDTAETPIDRRSLDLLEAMIERKSSEVLNEPGPHVEAAVAALKGAFNHDWASGETVQMANFLDQMGTMSQRELNAERLRQLRALQGMTKSGTVENVEIAWSLAHALYYSHNERDEGIAVIETALQHFRDEHSGALPSRLNTQLSGHITLLEGQRLFAAGEVLLQKELEQPTNASQKFWLKQRLNECYMSAYRNGGRVAFGSGGDLYRNLLNHLLKESESLRDSYRQPTMAHILNLFRNKEHRERTYDEDIKKYAFEQFPKLLRPQDSNYRYQVNSMAGAVQDLIGYRNGLAFLIERLENYPARFEHTYENPWQQFGYRMGEWRKKAGGIGDLEPRLLKIVLRELRRDLVTSNHRNRAMMQKRHSYYWAEKEADFVRVANEVAAQNKDSGQIVAYVAQYLFHNLDRYDRAIELMLDAHERSVLNESQQIQLVDLLHKRKRWGESIAILQPIVEASQHQMPYRVRLLKAYNGANRKQKRDEFLVETETYFRENKLWLEDNIAQLANCMVAIGLHESAVKYFGEVIPLHQRTAPNQGIGSGTLSSYYQSLSRAHAYLGNTIEAVDAAAGGIVSWGRRHEQRKAATYAMKSAIISAKDRDGFVAHLDQQAKETGSDSALIRKVLGMVLAEIKQDDKAVVQLKIAIELQPTDAEAHAALIKSFDALEQSDAAVEQMLAQLDFDRHNLALYKQLAERLEEDEEQSERAATSLVESAPSEAEHHQALAEFRQQQGRWDDAIAHWQQVAKLRALEPNGLLKLAAAQIHEKQWDDAKQTVKKLNQKQWPERFRQVENEIRNLQGMIP